ncbi:MAG: PAS domain S-box protein [Methanomicrobiales archaeon]|nr:PAS domain S-box protein [Methanomicrobiales archaeon]
MAGLLRVLYVDDDPGLLEIGKLFLEESGRFSVDIISSAPAALTLLNDTKFDAIISDYQMPGMDGIQFLIEVRAKFESIPFILFTGKGREEVVIQAINNGVDFYLQKGGEPVAQFAELVHKIQIAVEHHRATEKIQALNRLYSVLSATNKAIFNIQTKMEFFSEICRILVETGGFRMAWIGIADLEQNLIRPVTSAGHVDGYLDSVNISTEDVPQGRGPTGTAYREGKYFWSNDITQDPRMEPWRENALLRGYLANAAFAFALGTKNAGVLSLYAPVTGFFDEPIIDLLDELAVDISFFLRTIDDQNDRKRFDEELLRKSDELRASYEQMNATNETLRHTMDELSGREKLFRTLFQEMLNGFAVHEIICDENGKPRDYRFIDVNPAFERMTGLRRESLIGKTVLEVLPGIEPLWIERYGRVALTGSPDHFENYSGDLGRSFEVTVYQNAPYQFTTVISDITERKQAEADLSASEESLSAMLNGITESAFLMTPEGTVLAANETVARRLGMKQADDLVGQNALRILPKEVQMSRQIKIQEVIQSGQPAHFEDYRLDRVISQTIYPVKDPDGIVRRLAIFGVDVTDRKLTEEALHETNARLKFAFRSARSGSWEWDFPTGKLVWSPEFFELFGLPPEVPPSFETWLGALHPDDRTSSMEKIDQSVKDHKDLWNEYRVLLPEGGLRWIGAAGSTSYNDQGEPLRMSGICIDISERKQAEEALRESEARYRLLADNATDVIWTLDLKGNFIYVSPSIFQLRGYTREEVMHQSMREVLSEGSVALVEETIRQTLEEFKPGIIPAPTVTEVEQPCRDGSSVWTEVVSRLFVDETGNPAGFIGISRNITERRRAGELLRESEGRFRAILDATPFPIAFVDVLDNNINFWSRSALTLFGHTAPTTPEWYQIAYPDPHYRRDVIHRWKPYLEKAKHSGLPVNTGEYRVTCRDGSVRICELYAAFLQDNLVVTFNDITGRKQAEEALLKKAEELYATNEELTATDEELRQNLDDLGRSEMALRNLSAYNRSLLEASPDPLVTIDHEGKIADVNTSTETVTGYSRTELIGTDFSDYFTEPEQAKEGYQRVFTGGTVRDYPLSIRHRDGHITPVLYNATVYLDETGNISGVFAAARDITERKREEEALKESEGIVQDIIEKNPMSIQIVDREGFTLRVNPAFIRLFGSVPPPDFSIITDLVKSHPELENHISRVKNGEPVNLPDMSFNPHDIYPELPDVPTRVRAIIFPLNDMHGKPQRFVFMHEDITEQRLAEEALKQANERLLLATVAGGVGIWDLEVVTNKLTWDDQMFRLYGIMKENFGGAYETWKARVHPEDVEHGDAEVQMALRGEKEFNTEFRVVWPDGTVHTIRGLANVERDASGKAVRLIGTNYDITERKEAENLIRHALAEKEVLLREVHHRVKNNLAGILSLIELQISSLSDPVQIAPFKDLETRIRSMALVHESLCSAKDLTRINVASYTENLTRHLLPAYGTAGEVRCRIEMGAITLPMETATPCGLVMNEIVTNSLKYAFPKSFSCEKIRGEPCTIALTLHREGSDYILIVADNGMGMPEGTDATMSHSLGRFLIRFIVEHQLGGSIEISTARGTAYTIRFPAPAAKEGNTDEKM